MCIYVCVLVYGCLLVKDKCCEVKDMQLVSHFMFCFLLALSLASKDLFFKPEMSGYLEQKCTIKCVPWPTDLLIFQLKPENWMSHEKVIIYRNFVYNGQTFIILTGV